jgi:hypothetical protein
MPAISYDKCWKLLIPQHISSNANGFVSLPEVVQTKTGSKKILLGTGTSA